MSNLFLDTNVALDFFLKRKEFVEDARNIFEWGHNHYGRLFMSSLSFSNIAYIARKTVTGEGLYDLLGALGKMVEASPVDKNVVRKAIALQAKDFEDALQYFSAKRVHADYLITRNVKDFPFSEIPVLTPHDFLTL